jgi:hypothetical protein
MVREDKTGRGRREGSRRKVGSRRHNGDVKGRRVKRNRAKHILIRSVFIFFDRGYETRRSGARATGDRSVRGCDTPPRRSCRRRRRRRRRHWGRSRRVSRGWSQGCRRAIHQLKIKVLQQRAIGWHMPQLLSAVTDRTEPPILDGNAKLAFPILTGISVGRVSKKKIVRAESAILISTKIVLDDILDILITLGIFDLRKLEGFRLA